MNLQPPTSEALSSAEVMRLQELVEDLQFENKRLRGRVVDSDTDDRLTILRRSLGLKKTAARLVLTLWKRDGSHSNETLALAILSERHPDSDKAVLVRMHVLSVRNAIGADAIETDRGFGYRLSDVMRAQVTALLSSK